MSRARRNNDIQIRLPGLTDRQNAAIQMFEVGPTDILEHLMDVDGHTIPYGRLKWRQEIEMVRGLPQLVFMGTMLLDEEDDEPLMWTMDNLHLPVISIALRIQSFNAREHTADRTRFACAYQVSGGVDVGTEEYRMLKRWLQSDKPVRTVRSTYYLNVFDQRHDVVIFSIEARLPEAKTDFVDALGHLVMAASQDIVPFYYGRANPR